MTQLPRTCWQFARSEVPVVLNDAVLQEALPHAPPPLKQTVMSRAAVLTTLARFVADPMAPPRQFPSGDARTSPEHLLMVAAEAMTDELCGLTVQTQQAWFVEENDLLALALGGSWVQHAAEFNSSYCRAPS